MRNFLFNIVVSVFFVGNIQAQVALSKDSANISNGGFEKIPYPMQETPPGMMLVEGGEFKFREEGKPLRTDTVKSFYVSALEETNGQYLAYLSFVKKYYSASTYKKALPDTALWLKADINDSLRQYMKDNYLRHYVFHDYPVVGVSPEQILDYCKWKTDQLNEMILIREGVLEFFTPLDSSELFHTEAYLSGTFDPDKNKLPLFQPAQRGERRVRMEDGILSPRIRMLTINEWEVAAMAIGDENDSYIKTPKALSNRKFDKKNQFGHLYVKETGVASNNAMLVMKLAGIGLKAVYKAPANNYLVKGMYDNVSEWVCADSSQYITVGGSWLFPEPDYSWWPVGRDQNYLYPAFKTHGGAVNVSSCFNGFRLAMDHIGGIDPNSKRRK